MFLDSELIEARTSYATHRDAVYMDEDVGRWISPDRWTDLDDEARAIVDMPTAQLAHG